MDERIVYTLGLIVQVAGADGPVENSRNRAGSSGESGHAEVERRFPVTVEVSLLFERVVADFLQYATRHFLELPLLCTVCVAFDSIRGQQREVDVPCLGSSLLWPYSDLTISFLCQCSHVCSGILSLGKPLSSRGTAWLGPSCPIVGFTLLATDLVNLSSPLLMQSRARPSVPHRSSVRHVRSPHRH